MAIKAGVDLVLMPTTLRSKADLTKIDTIVNAVVDARNRHPEERLNESVRRILTLKENGGLEIQVLEQLKSRGSNGFHRDLERKIAAAAVTVVKMQKDSYLPFKVQTGDHVLLLELLKMKSLDLDLGMSLIRDGVLPKIPLRPRTSLNLPLI